MHGERVCEGGDSARVCACRRRHPLPLAQFEQSLNCGRPRGAPLYTAGARRMPLASAFHSVEKPSWELSSRKMSTEKNACTGGKHTSGETKVKFPKGGGGSAAPRHCTHPCQPTLPPAPHHEDADVVVLGEEEAVGALADGGLQVGRLLLDLRRTQGSTLIGGCLQSGCQQGTPALPGARPAITTHPRTAATPAPRPPPATHCSISPRPRHAAPPRAGTPFRFQRALQRLP